MTGAIYTGPSYTVPAAGAAYSNVYDGYNGAGTITHASGTLAVSNLLSLGYNSGGSGSYTLSGTGALSAGAETVGASGSGTLTQNGGTNTVTGNSYFYLGENAGSHGSYTLNGGTLNGYYENVGYDGTGTFT